MPEAIADRAEKAIKNKVFPGCVIGVVKKDGERLILPAGRFTYEEESPRVVEDTPYDLASITKAIPTACLALQLIDEGKLKATDKLVDYVPEFRNSDRERVQIQHLLTYTLDGYGLGSLRPTTAQEIVDIIMTRDFEKRPGTIFKYTNIPAFLLGMVIEKIYGQTLDAVADERFFKPLGMTKTTFFPERLWRKEEVPPTEINEWFGLVQGVVHDESAHICKNEGRIVGHAGVFSTVPDLLTFMEMLLHEGSLKGNTYFSPGMVARMGTNQIEHLGLCTGLGWELGQVRFTGTKAGPHTFTRTGFTGTMCACDVEKGIVYVILSNRIYPARPSDAAAINAFRASIGEIVCA